MGKLFSSIRAHPTVLMWGGLIASLAALAGLTPIADTFAALLPKVALSDAAVNATRTLAATEVFRSWFPFGLVLLVIAFLASVIGTPLAALGNYVASSRAATLSERRRAAMQEMILNTRRITEALYRDQSKSFSVLSLREYYRISANGDAECEKVAVVKGGSEPGVVWRMWEEADATAQPLETPSDIMFDVSSSEPDTYAYALPTENDSIRQEVAVFMLPPLKDGELRTLTSRFRWPGFASKITRMGSGRWFWTLEPRSGSTTCDYELILEFAAGSPSMTCVMGGRLSGTAQLKSETKGATQIWTYRDRASPLDGIQRELEFMRRR